MSILQLGDRAPRKDSNGRTITVPQHKLRRGDVLFSASNVGGLDKGSFITWLILALDGAGYSHSAFFDGKNVVEAAGSSGVAEKSVAEIASRNRYTDVYRFVSDDGKKLECTGWPSQPLSQSSARYINSNYGMSDAILAGVLLIVRRSIVTYPSMVGEFRQMLSHATRDLQDRLENRAAHARLTCTELIYRIFYEAIPVKKYRIRIRGTMQGRCDLTGYRLHEEIDEAPIEIPIGNAVSFAPKQLLQTDESIMGLSDEVRGLLKEISAFESLYRQTGLDGSLPLSGNDMLAVPTGTAGFSLPPVADYVTLTDLCTSSNLEEIGRLH